jgi:hypothetical protein
MPKSPTAIHLTSHRVGQGIALGVEGGDRGDGRLVGRRDAHGPGQVLDREGPAGISRELNAEGAGGLGEGEAGQRQAEQGSEGKGSTHGNLLWLFHLRNGGGGSSRKQRCGSISTARRPCPLAPVVGVQTDLPAAESQVVEPTAMKVPRRAARTRRGLEAGFDHVRRRPTRPGAGRAGRSWAKQLHGQSAVTVLEPLQPAAHQVVGRGRLLLIEQGAHDAPFGIPGSL